MVMLMGSWMMRCLRALSLPLPMMAGLEGVCGVIGDGGMEVESDGGEVLRLWDGDAGGGDVRSRFGILVFGPFAVGGLAAEGEDALRLEATMTVSSSSSDFGESLSTFGFALVFILANVAQCRIERRKFWQWR
jgi:hypothetical protein